MLTQHNLWTADLGDGTFQNPVLYADYSDLDFQLLVALSKLR